MFTLGSIALGMVLVMVMGLVIGMVLGMVFMTTAIKRNMLLYGYYGCYTVLAQSTLFGMELQMYGMHMLCVDIRLCKVLLRKGLNCSKTVINSALKHCQHLMQFEGAPQCQEVDSTNEKFMSILKESGFKLES